MVKLNPEVTLMHMFKKETKKGKWRGLMWITAAASAFMLMFRKKG